MNYDFETLIDRKNSGAAKWNMMKAAKPDVAEHIVPLSVADMEFKNAPEISDAIKKYIDESVPGYSEAPEGFYDCVCRFMREHHNWSIDSSEIVTTPGVVYALLIALRTVAKKGNGIIIMPPVYYPFSRVITSAECEIVKNPLIEKDGAYTVDFDGLENLAKDPNNTALIFCNPHNPVGRVWTKDELEKIANICLENNVFIISDDIHFDLIMPGYTHTVMASLSPEIADRTITCTAPSKTFNLAGLNHSNIIIPNEKVRREFRHQLELNATPMQTPYAFCACRSGYEKCNNWLDELITYIDENRRYVENFCAEKLPRVKVTALEGTYLQWIDLRDYNLAKDEQEKLMLEYDLFFDEGYVFGDEGAGFERINLACPRRVITDAMDRLNAALSTLQ